MLDPSKVRIALPLNKIDRVLTAKTVTSSVTNSVGNYHIIISTPEVLASPGLVPFGVYSVDGGTTYSNFTIYNSTPITNPVAVQIAASFNIDHLYLLVKVNSTVGGGGTIPIIISYGLIMGPSLDTAYLFQDSSYTQKTALDTRSVVPQVFASGTVPSDGTTYTIAHNLGYLPDIRGFYYYSGSQVGTTDTQSSGFSVYPFSVDTTNLYIATPTDSNTVWGYIIYYNKV